MSRVMLIDDDPLMLSLLKTLLAYEGYQTTQLDGEGSVDEILNRLRRDKPELILLDVHLGQINGLDLLRKLRKDKDLNSIRVLVSSGMELRSESFVDGADGFILKPYMPDELVNRIRDTLKAGG